MTERCFVETENRGVARAPWFLFSLRADGDSCGKANHQRAKDQRIASKNNESQDNRNFSRFPAFASFNLEVRGRGRPRYMN